MVDWSNEIGGNIVMASMKNKYDELKLKSIDIVSFLSENDPFIPFAHAKKYYESIGATTRLFSDKGHFNSDSGIIQLPEILEDITDYISVYTTRVDTVYGMTYAVLAPDHPRVYDFITDEQSIECEAYITEAASRSDQDRTNE